MIPTYRTPSDLPGTLPVFPLAGAILLPRAVLPLHIFEPRYLEMLDDALRGDRLLGIVQPAGDGGMTGSPQGRSIGLRSVGCAGRIRSYQELDDGRLMIALGGIARFRPGREIELDRRYRTFEVSYDAFVDDLAPGHGEAAVDRDRLLEVVNRYFTHRHLTADLDAMRRTGTEPLVNGLCLASPFTAEERQALLEAPTLAERVKLLVTLAEMEMASGQTGGGQRMQ